MQPISDGSNSMTVCQPMVMMLLSPFQAELTSTIGPGSRNRRIFDMGKSFFVTALIALCGSAVHRPRQGIVHPKRSCVWPGFLRVVASVNSGTPEGVSDQREP